MVLILGNTYTGNFDSIDKFGDFLLEHAESCGHRIPTHVDAASGRSVVPFMIMDDFRWSDKPASRCSGKLLILTLKGFLAASRGLNQGIRAQVWTDIAGN